MLSDEEKKAIDLLKNIDKQKCVMLECPVVKNNIERQLKIIELNRTIRKQSKEIEEINKSDASKEQSSMNYYNLYKELVDKIKAKIEEYEEKIKRIKEKDVWEEPYDSEKYVRYTNYISVLQSLLERE